MPSLNKAIEGEDGGYGCMYSLAVAVAPTSCPAKTVAKTSGFFENVVDILTAGLALPAAQPQTEFTINKTVPSLLSNTFETSSGFFSSTKPTEVKSSRIGLHISSCKDKS